MFLTLIKQRIHCAFLFHSFRFSFKKMTHWVDIVLVRAYGDICRIRLMEDRFGAGGTGEDGADFYPVIFFFP